MKTLPYLDIDLSSLTNKYPLQNKDDIVSYQVLLSYILLNPSKDNEAHISQSTMLDIFRTRLYKSIKQEVSSQENIPKQEYLINESILFRSLFKRTHLGNNLNKVYSTYRLNILDKGINIKDIKSLSFKSYITTIHKDSKAKLSEAEKAKIQKSKRTFKRDKTTFSNSIQIDKNFINQELSKDYLALEDYLKLKSIVDTTKSKLEIFYDIKSSGRHYSNIGLLKKELRNILLNDYVEYDISTAAPNFFLEVYKQITNKNLEKLDFYIKNKKEFREKIAELIKGVNFEDMTSEDKKFYYSKAKEILTMIFFGSKIKESSEDEYYNEELQEVVSIKYFSTSIEDALEKGEYRRFIDNNFIKEFLEELVKLMNTIDEYLISNCYDKNTRTLHVNNKSLEFRTKGNKLKYSRYNKAKALAFFYQSWESDFLLSARDTYVENTKDKNYFLLHDALFVKKDIDINLLINTKQSGNFKVKVNL